MKSTDKLTKKQVLAIPKLLKRKSIGQIAEKYDVSWQAIWYWIGQMKKRGIKIITRKAGQKSLLELLK